MTNIELLDQHCAKGKAPIRLGQASPFPTQCKPLEAEREVFLENKWPRSESAALQSLKDGLVAFGGQWALVPDIEDDLRDLLARGQLWGPTNKMMKGKQSQCHSNSALCWEANSDKLFLATGYALSTDGLWRQHSWCVHPRPRSVHVIETTTPRELYFGFVMGFEETLAFGYRNASSGMIGASDAVRQRYEFGGTKDESQEAGVGEVVRERCRA